MDRTFTITSEDPVYYSDGLVSMHRYTFVTDPAFVRAYQRGVDAHGGVGWVPGAWRAHIALWVATTASRLDGDFVECGVNYGFMSSAIMEYLDWDRLGKTFHLLDTFAGLAPRFITDETAKQTNEKALREHIYTTSIDDVRANFAQWRNHRITVGPVPDTLDQVDAASVAFLHIDMNCAEAEVAALRYFWPRLSPGGFVLLDDYTYHGYKELGLAMDAWSSEQGAPICALPTGQGLLIKPPRAAASTASCSAASSRTTGSSDARSAPNA